MKEINTIVENLVLIWATLFITPLCYTVGKLFAAKLFHVRIIFFSVGMGPTLFSFHDKVNNTRYLFQAIPLGTTLLLAERDLRRERHFKELLKQLIVDSSGIFSLLLFASSSGIYMGPWIDPWQYKQYELFMLPFISLIFTPFVPITLLPIDTVNKCSYWFFVTIQNIQLKFPTRGIQLMNPFLECYISGALTIPILSALALLLPLPFLDGGKILKHMIEYFLVKPSSKYSSIYGGLTS